MTLKKFLFAVSVVTLIPLLSMTAMAKKAAAKTVVAAPAITLHERIAEIKVELAALTSTHSLMASSAETEKGQLDLAKLDYATAVNIDKAQSTETSRGEVARTHKRLLEVQIQYDTAIKFRDDAMVAIHTKEAVLLGLLRSAIDNHINELRQHQEVELSILKERLFAEANDNPGHFEF